MKKANIFKVLITSMLLMSGAFAETYYVSELYGDDTSGDGSATNQWATIQKAADVAVAGDIIVVQFGEYLETVVPKENGTDGNPIVIQAEEKGEAMITTGDAFSDALVYTQHADSIWVAADVFREVTSVTEDGTALIGLEHVDSLYAGTWFQDRTEAKLYVIASDKTDPTTHIDTVNFALLSFDIVEGHHITIDGFNIRNGIQAVVTDNLVPLTGLVIQNNAFEGDGDLTTNETGISIDGGAADSVNTYENFLIDQNTFTDYWRAIKIANAGRNSVISGNTFTNIGIPEENDPAIRLEGSEDYPAAQCQGLVIERNMFDQIYGRALYFRYGDIDSVKVQNNISHNIGSIFAIFYNSRHIDVINNTIVYSGSEFAVRYKPECSGSLYNNIFVANYSKPRSLYVEDNRLPDPTVWDYNYWVTDTSVTQASNRDDKLVRWKDPNGVVTGVSSGPGGPHAVYGHTMIAEKDTTFDANGDSLFLDAIPDMGQAALPLFADPNPLFSQATVADFSLVEGSLAIDAANPDVAPELDFFGHVRDENPDIGAIEFGVTGIRGDELDRLFPEEYALSQNYPNPFNPATTIEYKLPAAGFVKLTVYNLLGQEVVRLVDGIRSNGTHTVTWNSRDSRGNTVPTGIYLCRLEAGDVTKTVKMLLLK